MVVEDAELNGRSEAETHNVISPHVGILVTADVQVIQYGSSSSSDAEREAKCEIITNLNAVFKEISEINNSIFCPTEELPEVELDQPMIRKSKKNTQLNKSSCFYSSYSKEKLQIDRIFVLPKSGCTTRRNLIIPVKTLFPIKSSKSWNTVRKVTPDLKELGLYLTKSMGSITDGMFSSKAYQTLQSLEEPDDGEVSTKNLQRKDHCVQDNHNFESIGPPFENDSDKETKTIFKALNDSEKQNQILAYLNNVIDEEEETCVLTDLNLPKATRNVSILHRPKTRDKSTSTTTLASDKSPFESAGSLKGLLMPYISAGKEFPSEILLKLTPKDEALKYIQNEALAHQTKSANSSEFNLLAPKLNVVKNKSHKRKKGLLGCLPFLRKNRDGDVDSVNSESLNSSNKEIYFPSLVEVYNKEKKGVKEVDSNMTANDSNHSKEYKK